jgi:hypothetical protein
MVTRGGMVRGSIPTSGLHEAGGRSWDQEMNDAEYKWNVGAWETHVRKKVGKMFFNVMQFVDEDDERYGSTWQGLVCATARVSEKWRERFWLDKGMKIARATINRRRQNTAMAMRKKFKGKS